MSCYEFVWESTTVLRGYTYGEDEDNPPVPNIPTLRTGLDFDVEDIETPELVDVRELPKGDTSCE